MPLQALALVKNCLANKVKFHIEPIDGGTKVCSNSLGHLTRWPPRLYMVKTLKKLLLQNQNADDLESWYVASGAQILPSLFK